jgi:hypothetical protein
MKLSMKLVATLLSAAVLAAASASRADETYSPGVNSAYTYISPIPITGNYVDVAQIQIVKGRKNRVLEVDVQITDTMAIVAALASYVRVNNVMMHPPQNNIPVMTDCDPSYTNCTMTSNFWADLDQLEVDNPGVFKNQPLDIHIFGIDGGGSTPAGALTVRARMLKK